MKNITTFIQSFLSRSGSYVLSATILARILSFTASWIALQLIPNKELGFVIYAFQIITFIIPVAGFGLNQSLIRYGAQLKSKDEKDALYIYVLKKGTFVSFILIGLVVLVSFYINFELEKTRFYLLLLSSAIVTHYILELIKVQYRLQKNNKLYAYTELTYTIILVILVFVLSSFFKELGYALSLIIAPLITALIFSNKLTIKWKTRTQLTIIDFSFWSYGLFASLANVTTQLLISIDILLIGYLLKDMELVTAFKYVSIIPYSFLFLSKAIIITDFVDFTEKINDKLYIKRYIKNYVKLFSMISILCVLFIYLFGEKLLLFFDADYVTYYSSLFILTIGISGILTLSSIFGNLLSSIGKAHINFITTSIAVFLNIILNSYLIPKYGLLGAAITSATLMWFVGVLSMLFFFYFFNKLKASHK